MLRKKLSAALLAGATLSTLSPSLFAEEAGDWLVRGRFIHVNPNDDSSEVSGIPQSAVGVDADSTVELDFTYFLSKHWALELILATTNHEISGSGSISALENLVQTKVLPPTLTLQYHNYVTDNARLYLGAGLNYTLFYDENGLGAFDGADIDLDSSFGLSAQAGLDFNVSENWFMNIDVKFIKIDTEAEIRPGDGSVLTVDADIDPWVIGLGVGTRF